MDQLTQSATLSPTLSLGQVAALLGVGETTVRQLALAGDERVHALRVGRYWRSVTSRVLDDLGWDEQKAAAFLAERGLLGEERP